jgi:galactokinase
LAIRQAETLEREKFEEFLRLVRQSGESSALHLQNLWCDGHPKEQAVPVAIAAAEHLLNERGAVRVHGGGFAGTIQAYVPLEQVETFRTGMEAILGDGAAISCTSARWAAQFWAENTD